MKFAALVLMLLSENPLPWACVSHPPGAKPEIMARFPDKHLCDIFRIAWAGGPNVPGSSEVSCEYMPQKK